VYSKLFQKKSQEKKHDWCNYHSFSDWYTNSWLDHTAILSCAWCKGKYDVAHGMIFRGEEFYIEANTFQVASEIA
jgi:hypothetical protein